MSSLKKIIISFSIEKSTLPGGLWVGLSPTGVQVPG